LKKLEKLQKEIHREHDLRVNASKKAPSPTKMPCRSCNRLCARYQAEINAQREERLAAIEASCDEAAHDERPHVLGLKPAQIKMLAASGQLNPGTSGAESGVEEARAEEKAVPVDAQGPAAAEAGSKSSAEAGEELQRAADLPRGTGLTPIRALILTLIRAISTLIRPI